MNVTQQDSWLNGIIAGCSGPVVSFALLKGIEWVLKQTYMPDDWPGFSLKFMLIVSLLGNIALVKVFDRQEREYSVRGLIAATILLALCITFYFYNPFRLH
ncbi:hypothetical protein C7N43_11435 [Sphingobacteriales bacterium UPWRP_1]|nr:hypothetical protein C7N43_11435 [Sphingobacteriales bacterium UPWRP_1]